jgi:putative FmdB family regulatory protein
MPLYEYRCDGCGHEFEKLVFHEGGPIRCPACDGEARKLLSTFSYAAPDEACAKLPKGEARELCTECKQGGAACPYAA